MYKFLGWSEKPFWCWFQIIHNGNSLRLSRLSSKAVLFVEDFVENVISFASFYQQIAKMILSSSCHLSFYFETTVVYLVHLHSWVLNKISRKLLHSLLKYNVHLIPFLSASVSWCNLLFLSFATIVLWCYIQYSEDCLVLVRVSFMFVSRDYLRIFLKSFNTKFRVCPLEIFSSCSCSRVSWIIFCTVKVVLFCFMFRFYLDVVWTILTRKCNRITSPLVRFETKRVVTESKLSVLWKIFSSYCDQLLEPRDENNHANFKFLVRIENVLSHYAPRGTWHERKTLHSSS